MKKAILYKKLQNKLVQCTACKHQCVIKPGDTGICGVRQNIDGDLHLLVYGEAVSANVDPIEKKPLFHFLPGTEVLSIGTLGCNFACAFCQNWDISQTTQSLKKHLEKQGKLQNLAIELAKCSKNLPPDQIVSVCKKKQIASIAYTYNEPTVAFEYALDTAVLAKNAGIRNVYISNGYASDEAIDKIAPYLDAVNIDLKAFTEKFYRDICKAKLKPVLENIERYCQKGIWMELTTLIIPDENDSDKELKQIAKFIASLSRSIPWHVTRFNPCFKMQDRSPTPEQTIDRAYQIGKEAGLKYVYAGNVFKADLQSTYCSKCGNLLIKRNWGYTKIIDFKQGKCGKCGMGIEGVWT